jgi:hypothetical protein
MLSCKTSPAGVCTCAVAEAAPNGVLVLRQEHSAVGRNASRYEPQKHETQLTYSQLVKLTLTTVSMPTPINCGVEGCGREVAQVAPGGLLELKRTHYGETHVRRLTLFELTRLLLDADAKSLAEASPRATASVCGEGG